MSQVRVGNGSAVEAEVSTGGILRERRQLNGESKALPPAVQAKVNAASRRIPGPCELAMIAILLLVSASIAVYVVVPQFKLSATWRQGCRQCSHAWWDRFWNWRLDELDSIASEQAPPDGMEWDWIRNGTNTDWWNASAELVDTVIATHVDAKRGPVLHVGCGDSPLPGLLHAAGFRETVSLDIVPQLVTRLRARYPSSVYPGLSFAVRDFLANGEAGGGPPPPLHRFVAVIDKAGIWDWLQDEKPSLLPRLLDSVRSALLLGDGQGEPGAYIVATKQSPSELQASLSTFAPSSKFIVEDTVPLMSGAAIAWAYVLLPA